MWNANVEKQQEAEWGVIGRVGIVELEIEIVDEEEIKLWDVNKRPGRHTPAPNGSSANL